MARNPANRRGGRPADRASYANEQIHQPPTRMEPPAETRPHSVENTLAQALNRNGQGDLTISPRMQPLMGRMGQHFDQPNLHHSRNYLRGLRDTLSPMGLPTASVVEPFRPGGEQAGAFSPQTGEVHLQPPMGTHALESGYETAEAALGEVGIHELTHAFDMRAAANKPYRQQALGNLEQVLPTPDFGRGADDFTARHGDMIQAGGILDPHIELTTFQNVLRKSQAPLLSEFMANFAELGNAADPVAHLMGRPAFQQGETEDWAQYSTRISGDYDRVMGAAVRPYAIGISNDQSLPSGIRDFYRHSLLRVPASGAEVVNEIANRRMALMTALTRPDENNPGTRRLATGPEMLRTKLRNKLRDMQDARKKKR